MKRTAFISASAQLLLSLTLRHSSHNSSPFVICWPATSYLACQQNDKLSPAAGVTRTAGARIRRQTCGKVGELHSKATAQGGLLNRCKGLQYTPSAESWREDCGDGRLNGVVFENLSKYFWIRAEEPKFWVLYTDGAVCLVPPFITVNLMLQDFLLRAETGREVELRPRQGSPLWDLTLLVSARQNFFVSASTSLFLTTDFCSLLNMNKDKEWLFQSLRRHRKLQLVSTTAANTI